MSAYIAVQGAELEIVSATGGKGTVKITSSVSTSVKVGSKGSTKGVYEGKIEFSISGYGSSTIGDNDGIANGSIQGTSVNKSNGNAFVLEGDSSASITVNGHTTTGSSTVASTDIVTVKVKSAGQTAVKSN